MNRRQWLQASLALGLGWGRAGVSWAQGSRVFSGAVPRVVVVGGGFGGATAAKYLRKWSAGQVEVILIERQPGFVSCPASNEVIGGFRDYASLERGYGELEQNWGVRRVRATVTAIDPVQRRVMTETAGAIAYDRLILAPGVDFVPGALHGYDPHAPIDRGAPRFAPLHAWKAGVQTVALRQQLEAMPDGGTYVLTIPLAPYRCPPGPYERACLVAHYFKQHKPRSKVVVLDANEKIQSKETLFQRVWAQDYPGMIEYHPRWNAMAFDARRQVVTSDLGEVQQGDVCNLVPAQRAAEVARLAGVVNVNDRWADIHWLTYESTALKNIHVIGDALQAAPLMPKSGHMANQHGKAVAAALLSLLADREPEPMMLANTCYSRVDAQRGIHVCSVHRYQPEQKIPRVVAGSGGISVEPSVLEGDYARAWADNIWRDTLG